MKEKRPKPIMPISSAPLLLIFPNAAIFNCLLFIFLLFIFSFGFGIVLFGFLNSFNLFGAKLSYFISGQFTIYLSILLIFIYQKQVLKLEKKYENTY